MHSYQVNFSYSFILFIYFSSLYIHTYIYMPLLSIQLLINSFTISTTDMTYITHE